MKYVLAVLIACLPVTLQADTDFAPTPPMGWNSWNKFQTKINEQLIHDVAEAMIANGMRDAGYIYINLDDGWSMKERDENGNLVGDSKRFPSGMKALGDYLHDHGFKFGIYNCAGTQTCAGYPGSMDHEQQDAKTYASWGVDYLKYDWCHTERLKSPEARHIMGAVMRTDNRDDIDRAITAEAYMRMSDALRATKRPIVFSICEWGGSQPWTWAEGVGQLWRTTGDIGPCYDCNGKYNSGWKTLLDKQVGLEKYAGPGHWNDPDMLEVGNGSMTLPESRAHFSLWCILAAPLIAGNDVRRMKDEIREILTAREAVAVDQDPLGKEGFRASREEGKEIWAKELSGGDWAVCMLNTGSETAKLDLDWKKHDFLHGLYSVRDVWGKQDVGDTGSPYSAEIESHGAVLLRLHPKE